MTLHGDRQLVGADALPVIEHTHQTRAAAFDVDIDLLRTGIE
jgi:hypothetical protein